MDLLHLLVFTCGFNTSSISHSLGDSNEFVVIKFPSISK